MCFISRGPVPDFWGQQQPGGAGSVWHKIFNINSVFPGSSGTLRLACFLCVYCVCRPRYASCSSAPEEERRIIHLWMKNWEESLKRLWHDRKQLLDQTREHRRYGTVSRVCSSSDEFSRIKTLVLFIHVGSNLPARPYARHRTVMQTCCSRASAGLKGQMLIFMLTSRRRIHRLHMQTEVCWLWTGGLRQQQRKSQLDFNLFEFSNNTRSVEYNIDCRKQQKRWLKEKKLLILFPLWLLVRFV